jgi:hypothetical protein
MTASSSGARLNEAFAADAFAATLEQPGQGSMSVIEILRQLSDFSAKNRKSP